MTSSKSRGWLAPDFLNWHSYIEGGSIAEMDTFEVKNISISISRAPNDVYEFISNPMNLPKWASGLSGSIQNVNGEWVAESPMGKVKIKFAEPQKLHHRTK